MAAKKSKKSKRAAAASEREVEPGGAPYRILSLDGGGIRGLITAVWLCSLEKRLRKAKGRGIAESFDLIAGTSTGAILGCALSAGIPPERIRDLYLEWGRRIFPRLPSRLWSRATRFFSEGISAPKYDGRGLEAALRATFGNKRMRDLAVTPTLVTSYNTLTRSAEVFKNTQERSRDLLVWEVVKCSASAPTYFPAHVITVDGARSPMIDGGVVANNPTACAVAEAIHRFKRDRTGCGLDDILVASFGTGQVTRPISISEAREWGALEWAVPVIDVLMDGAGDAVDWISNALAPQGRYFRFQVRLDDAYDDLDNADQTNLNALMNIANQYLKRASVRAQLDALVAAL